MEPLTKEQSDIIVADDLQFRLHVMESLGELRTDMRSLVGNGQPGRMDKLERRVERHGWYIALAVGGVGVLGFLISNGITLLPTLLGSGK